MGIATDIASIVFGIINQSNQSRFMNSQIEMQKLKNKETQQKMDLIDKYLGQAETLPEPYRTGAKIQLGNTVLSGKTEGEFTGGGYMPGMPRTQQTTQPAGQGGGYMKSALMKELFGLEPKAPIYRSNIVGPGGQPYTIGIDQYTNQPVSAFPEYIQPQFQEETLPSGEKVRRWVRPPGMGIGGGAQPSPQGRFVTQLSPADTPMTDTDAPMYIHPETLESPPVGMTPRQANEMGFKRLTTNARNQIDAFKGVIAVANNIEELMKDVFPPAGGALDLGRANRKIGAILQTNPKAAEFDNLVNATLAPFIRALGEKGTLADNDVARAKNMMPQLTDSPDVAWRNLRRLKKLFTEIQQSMISGRYDSKNGVSGKMNLQPGKTELQGEDPLGLRKP